MKYLLLLCALLSAPAFADEKEITLYSVYEAERLAPIFKPFTDRTGIEVKVVFGTSEELIEKMKQEGENSPADLHLDKDIVFLGEAQRQGLFQPFQSAQVEKNVGAQFIETGKNWLLLFYRARVIMYNTQKVAPSELSTYEALVDAKWNGRLCLRTSGHSYNQALTAYLTKYNGESKTVEILDGWSKNLAFDPNGGDRDVIKAIANGECDVGIANTYYLAPMIKADANFPVRPFFSNQGGNGAHINGVGIGIAKNSKNVAEANLLLAYLTSKEVQTPVAGGFFQYPVNSAAAMEKELVDFGPFQLDSANIGDIASEVPAAKEVIRKSILK